MANNSCMCLTCGRAFILALEPGQDLSDQSCPICGGANIVSHDPRNFLESLFGGFSGG